MNGFSFPFAGRIVVIAPECMGYRSLAAMALLAVVLVIWQRPGLFKSLVLLACSSVLAVLGNMCRIGFLLLVMKFLPEDWYAPIHDVAGFVAILVESVILGNICDFLKRKGRDNSERSGK